MPPSDLQVFLGAMRVLPACHQAIKRGACSPHSPPLPAPASTSISLSSRSSSLDLSLSMAPPDQPPNLPNTFVDHSANPITLTNPDSSTQFTLPALFRAYAVYNVDLRYARTNSAVPVEYVNFSACWNQDPSCPYRFSTYDPTTTVVTTVGAPFPAGLLNVINPPPAPRAPTPPTVFEFSADQNEVIQYMLWRMACRESFFDRKCEAACAKRVDDHCSKREEYHACDSAMGRARTPQKNPAVPPAAATTAVPIACGGGTSGTAPTTSVAVVATQGSAAPSVPIVGPSNVVGPSTVLALPLTASSAPRSSSTSVPSTSGKNELA